MKQEITAAKVARLRKATGEGMMDCKRALEIAKGDEEIANYILQLQRKNTEALKNEKLKEVLGKILSDLHAFDLLNEQIVTLISYRTDINCKEICKDMELTYELREYDKPKQVF